MQLDAPLLSLIQSCETLCVAGCCGREAFDFSPIHIASYLLRYTGKVDEREVAKLRVQLDNLSANYGTNGASEGGAFLDVLNEALSDGAIDAFVADLRSNITRAIEIIAIEEQRTKA